MRNPPTARLTGQGSRFGQPVPGLRESLSRAGCTALPRQARILFAAAVIAISTQVAAGTVPPDPWQIVHVARALGTAEVARDGMDDPQIHGTLDGLHYRVTFYGCRLGRDCDTILFDARFARNEWSGEGPPADLIAAWNRTKLFGRAWADDAGRAVLDHAVAMEAGLPEEALRANFDSWAKALTEFAADLGVR